jgi:hypothetical protein
MEKTAFPVRNRWDSGNEGFDLEDSGMTLRDYFAGQALVSLSQGYKSIDLADRLAEQCYTIADAMMRRRGEGGE